MDRTLKQSKKDMRQFMRANYKDEHLISAIDRCRAGSLQFNDCDCFIGHVCVQQGVAAQHWLQRARLLPYAVGGENGYQRLADNDGKRQRRLLPMLRAEIRRRAGLLLKSMGSADPIPAEEKAEAYANRPELVSAVMSADITEIKIVR